MAYTPQLTPNSPDDLRTSDIYNAWNPFEQMITPIDPQTQQRVRPWKPNYGMPNCTAYAWSRFWAICRPQSPTDRRPTLSLGNASNWWGNTGDGYQRGQTPQLGAVACWRDDTLTGEPGHVAIVEEILPDGSIRTSNSNWTEDQSQEAVNYFYTRLVAPPYDSYGQIFQGFIYNPYAEGGEIKKWLLMAGRQKHDMGRYRRYTRRLY